MKKSLTALLCAAALAACGQQQPADNAASGTTAAASLPAAAAGMVNIDTNRGPAQVPLKPERVAVYDWGVLDTLGELGVEVGASTEETSIEYLRDTVAKAKHVGTLFEPNYEALNEYRPQLIITGARTAKAFDQLSQIAPTIEMTVDNTDAVASAKQRIAALGTVFGKEAEAKALEEKLDKAFADAKAAAQGKGKALVIQVSGGKLSAYGANSRLGGWLHKDIGVEPVDTAIKEGSHGQPVSFEYIKEKNPDWLFVLDRTSAIGEKGEAAKDVLNNPLVAETTAWKKGQVVYIQPAAYLSAGGARQLINSAKQAQEAFEKAK